MPPSGPSRSHIVPPGTLLRRLGWTALVAGASAAAPVAAQAPDWTLSDPAAARWTLRSWTARDGLPQNSVNDLVQTGDGFLWIATFGGLARFDGATFETLDLAAGRGLEENRILSLAEDAGGGLLLGYEHHGVARMDESGRVAPVAFVGPEPTAVWGLEVDGAGTAWAATEQGLARRAAGAEAFDWVLPGGAVRELAVAPGGVWVVAVGRALIRLAPDGTPTDSVPLATLDGAGEVGTVRDLRPVEGGALRVATSGGLFEIGPDAPAHPRPIRNGGAWRIELLASGETVVGADGVVLGPDGEPMVRGPRGVNVYTSLRDREGSTWFGTRGGGLLQLRERPIRRYTLPTDVPIREVPAVAVIPGSGGGHELWAASTCRGIFRFDGGALVRRPFAPGTGEAGLCPRQLEAVGPGRLLVRYGTRLLHLAPDGPLFAPPDGARILSLARGPRGEVRVLTDRGYHGLDLGNDAGTRPLPHWTRLRSVEGVAPPSGPLAEDPDGTLWIPQADGLLRVDAGGTRLLTEADGLPPGEVRAVHRSGDGALWVGTYGGGVARMTADGVRRLTRTEGLADNFVSAIFGAAPEAGDRRGPTARPETLWFLGNKALFGLPASEVAAWLAGERDWVHTVDLTADEGFVEPAGPALVRDGDGGLWVGSLDGVLQLDLARRPRNRVPPRPHIAAVAADDAPLEGPPWRIPAGGRRVEVAFTAPTFVRPHAVRFRHRLQGPDDLAWSRPSPSRRAVFTDIRPGDYRLEVEAINEEGIAGAAPAVLAFRVEPEPWETWWFRAAALLLAVAALAGVAEVRARSERRRSAALQREIDERRRAERQRDAVEARLRRAARLEAVGQLTGGVAHDFNNLLTVVLGNLELARDELGEADAAGVGAVLDRARSAAERGARVTSQLLTFARRQHLRTEAVRVDRLTTGMAELLQQALGEQATLVTRTRGDLWPCTVDGGQLETALLNLVLNARDAMPTGGTVTLTLAHHTVRREGTAFGGETMTPGDYVRISVADTGVGIPEDRLEAIFQPFFTTKEVGRGTGLGLSMVYGLVVQCGGFIDVESTVGEDTVVHLHLPRSDDAEEAEAAAPDGTAEGSGDGPEPRGHGERILVVEDNAGVRDVTVRMLDELGYTTLAAPSGALGLVELARHADVELVLSDVVMPGGMSGRDLRDRLAMERPELPVVLMSGYVPTLREGGESAAAPDGDDRVLRKPFSRPALAAAVRSALARPTAGLTGPRRR